MTKAILTVEGRGATLEAHEDRLVARRSGVMTFVAGNSNKEIHYDSIKSASIAQEATWMSGGLFEISTGSGALGDYHFWFPKSKTSEVQALKDFVDGKIAELRRARTHTPQRSVGGVADEIAKLAALRDQGILTEAEFNAKKKQLLGL